MVGRESNNGQTEGTNGINFSAVEFEELAAIVAERAGVFLSAHKQREIESRLYCRFPYIESLDGRALIQMVKKSDSALQNLINSLTIGESYFFRNRPHFAVLKEHILPDLIRENQRHRTLRIWCAGCATGEEPYSIAMLIEEHFSELHSWDLSIIATDVNTSFLEHAKRALYGPWSFRGVGQAVLDEYFTAKGEKQYQLRDDIVEAVEFRPYNLADMPYGDEFLQARFDILLCRNVLIYFSFDLANEISAALADRVNPGGYMLVGHADSFPALGQLQAIYQGGTYYFRKPVRSDPAPRNRRPSRLEIIPGIGVDPTGRHLAELADHALAGAKKRMPSRLPRFGFDEIPPVDSGGDRVSELLDQARDSADQGDLETATELLEELAQGGGRVDHRVYFLKAIVAEQRGQIPSTVASLKQAIFLKRDFVIAHYYMGVICEREGHKKDAMRYFRNTNRLLREHQGDWAMDEAEGLSAEKLAEIVENRLKELQLDLEVEQR